jgi:hypothetical protein
MRWLMKDDKIHPYVWVYMYGFISSLLSYVAIANSPLWIQIHAAPVDEQDSFIFIGVVLLCATYIVFYMVWFPDSNISNRDDTPDDESNK